MLAFQLKSIDISEFSAGSRLDRMKFELAFREKNCYLCPDNNINNCLT
jgi:hypothetical protein